MIFPITQILREINFWDSRSAKSDILTNLEALNCDVNEFLHFLKAEIHQINYSRAPITAKTAILELLSEFSKIAFT